LIKNDVTVRFDQVEGKLWFVALLTLMVGDYSGNWIFVGFHVIECE
jgi:hypothetical protein